MTYATNNAVSFNLASMMPKISAQVVQLGTPKGLNPVTSNAANTPLAPKKATAPKNGPTVELLFGEMVADNPRYARKGSMLYKWNGRFWESLDAEAGSCEALRWLALNHPGQATPARAEACFKSARMMASVMPDQDKSRVIVPLQNCCLDISPAGFRRLPHDPSYGMTFVLNCELPGDGEFYQPADVPSNSYLGRYLDSSLPDLEVRAFLQEMAGDTLMPNVRFQLAAVLKGKGRNGKSIYTRLLSALHSKVAHMRLDKLSGFDLTPLLGASLAIVDEVPAHGIDQQTMKTLISGETVTVNRKFQDPVAVEMTAKWVICTNNDQKCSDNSDGYWRRQAIIPFDHQIPESQVIPGLDKLILDNEMMLFLDWCLAGLQRLLNRGNLPATPKAVEAAKQQAILASNNVLAWISENGVAVGNHAKSKDNAFEHYDSWCRFNNYQPKASNKFWGDVKNHFGEALQEVQATKGGKRVRMVNLAID